MGRVEYHHDYGQIRAAAITGAKLMGRLKPTPGNVEARLQAQEALLEMAGKVANFGGWSIDLATRQVTWSDQVCAIHDEPPGTSPGVEQGINYYAPEYRDRIQQVYLACVNDGTPYDEELQIITARGRRVWVRTIGQAVHDEQGRIIKVQGAFQDITDRKAIENQARQEAQRLQDTLDHMPDPFLMLDSDWRIRYLNKAAEQLLQRSRATLIDRNLWDEYPEAKTRAFYAQYHRAITEQCTVEFEEYYGAPLECWLNVKAYPVDAGLAVYFRDVTDRRQAEAQLRESETRFRYISQVTADAVWDWDALSDTMWWSEAIYTQFGYHPMALDAGISSWTDHIHPDDRDTVMASIEAAMATGKDSWSGEYRFMKNDGTSAYVWDRCFFIRDVTGRVVRAVGGKNDITAYREQQQQIARQAQLLDKARDSIVIRTIDNRITFWNKGAEHLYGWSADEAMDRNMETVLYKDPGEFEAATQYTLDHGEWRGELRPFHKQGHRLWIESQWTLVRDEQGAPVSIFSISTDITERKANEEAIHRLAFYDTLTKLPNRQLLLDRLQHAIAASSRHQYHSALLFIDLDNFKSLNDTLGHDTGDLLLQQVARRLLDTIRQSDSAARLGGDEFIVLLENLDRDQIQAANQAKVIANKLLAAITEPYRLAGYDHQATASIGITLFSGAQENVEELLKRADLAMYQAKEDGRNTVRFFDPDMQAAINTRVTLEAELRDGIQRQEFVLHYQPQVNDNGQIIGAEALLRWQHPGRGMISPLEFIPLAEDTGLILPLGDLVLATACQQLLYWSTQPAMADLCLSVNISARQFQHPDFVDKVRATLAETGANPARLMFELTESMLVGDMQYIISKMNMLKSLGIAFSLDDFGTGYSSLSYLKLLPFDMLKIDKSFIDDVITDPSDTAITRMIITLGRSLGLVVIAEGVETEEQRQLLVRLGCSDFQGYLFSKPLPIDAFEQFINTQPRSDNITAC